MFILYPEDVTKTNWDLFITLILLISCIITPLRIAFGEDPEPTGWAVTNITIDLLFLIDILVMFNSAYYDEDFQIIESRKMIANAYVRSWFFIDAVAIIPFEYFVEAATQQSDGSTGGNANNFEMVRIARMGRLYKLIKMTKLLRILKIIKQRSQLLKYLNDILKIGLGFERLFFFLLIFIIMCHIMTCIWLIAASFSGETSEETSWQDDYKDLTSAELYITSLYFAVTTITTVGYGDISG